MIAYIKPSINSIILLKDLPPRIDDAPKITDEIYGYSEVEIPDELTEYINDIPKCEDFDLTDGVFIFNQNKYAERIAAEEEEEL